MQIIFRNYLVFYQLFKFRRTRDIRSNQQCFGAGHFCWLQLQLLRLKATLELERSWSGAGAELQPAEVPSSETLQIKQIIFLLNV